MHFCVSCLPCPTNARPTSQHPCGPCRHILSTMWTLDTYNVYLYKKTQLTTAIKSVNPTGKQKDTTWRQDWLPGSLPAASRITETYYCLVTYFKRDVLVSLSAHTCFTPTTHVWIPRWSEIQVELDILVELQILVELEIVIELEIAVLCPQIVCWPEQLSGMANLACTTGRNNSTGIENHSAAQNISTAVPMMKLKHIPKIYHHSEQKDRQRDRETERRTDRQTDRRQTQRQCDRATDRQTDKQTDRQTERQRLRLVPYTKLNVYLRSRTQGRLLTAVSITQS